MARLAVILLVDPAGRVLLQERDEHAPRAANLWGMVGGHVEDGESFEAAAHRELVEETGLTGVELRLWVHDTFEYSDQPGQPNEYTVWWAPADLTDADIVVGEGRQIVFVEPDRIAALPQSESSAHFLPRFLASDAYRSRPGTTDLPVAER